jgi:hypothetical protein
MNALVRCRDNTDSAGLFYGERGVWKGGGSGKGGSLEHTHEAVFLGPDQDGLGVAEVARRALRRLVGLEPADILAAYTNVCRTRPSNHNHARSLGRPAR